jgi:drug/metabolite transporter, DME family
MEESPLKSRLLLVVAAVLFSTGGAAIKGVHLEGWQIACFRSGVAAIALLIALPEARRGWSIRLAAPAAAYASTLILFVLATRLTTSANAIFLQSTAPLYVLLLGPWLLSEKIRRSDVFYIMAVASGMVLLFLGSQNAVATAPDPPRGNLLAAASGLSWAFTVIGLRWVAKLQQGSAALTTVALGNILAFIATLSMAVPLDGFRSSDLLVILYLGVFQIGLAYVCMVRAIRRVTAFETSIVLLLEPVLNPIWTWIVHGESAGRWALAGGGVILLATMVNTWRQRFSS